MAPSSMPCNMMVTRTLTRKAKPETDHILENRHGATHSVFVVLFQLYQLPTKILCVPTGQVGTLRTKEPELV